MPITTNETVDIKYNNVTVDTYGLSDTLDNFTIDDIKNYLYCSCTNKIIRGFQEFVSDGDITMFNDIFPFYTTKLATKGRFLFDVNAGSTLPIPGGAYVFTVWLQCSDTLELTTENIGNAKLVTSMNAPRMKYTLPTPTGVKDNITTWAGGNGSQCYATGDEKGSLSYTHNIDAHNTIDIGISNIHPYMLIVLDNIVFFWRFRMDTMKFLSRPQNHNTYGAAFVGGRAVTAYDETTYSVLGTKIKTLSVGLPYDWNTGTGSSTSSNPDSWGTADDNMIVYAEGGGNQSQTRFGCVRFYWYPNTRHEALLLWAGCGVKFYADKLYKPIIENGYVTGYTDNMDEPSDLDNWDGDTSHTVPTTPPSPTPTGDNENEEIEMPLAYIGGTAGFVQFIKINSAGLASADDISDALSRFDITTIGKDLLRNFVSFKCFAVLNIDPSNTVTRQISVAGHKLTDANDNPLNGQVIGGLLPTDFTIGTAPRYFNDYRDYAPYTKLEAYIPFCGWFTLPSWCIGLPITGTMFTDLYNGTVKAVIFAGSTVVAEVGGCCAYDIPFVADATGAKAGAVISSALSTAAATAATISMPNVATGITAASSAANLICAANSNSTTLKGVMGDGSNLNGLLHCYLKITRPQSPTRSNVIPESYKHEFGIPTYKEIVLRSGDGYIQVNDADIQGTMTDREKQMIIDGFRHGLIL